MAEPTSAYSTYDLILEVAKAAKITYHGSDGQQHTMVPTNFHDFDRCLGVVNAGIKRFIHDAPVDGWKWQEQLASITFGIVEATGTVDSGSSTTLVDLTLAGTYDADDDLNGYYVYDTTQQIQALITDYTTLTGTITVAAWLDYYGNASSLTPTAGDLFSVTDVATVNGEKHRYFLPDNFGEVAGVIEYAKQSNVGHIGWVHEVDIRRANAVSTTLGNPNKAAVRSVLNRKWELIVDPSPTAVKTVKFPYRIGFDKLVALSGISSSASATTLVDSDFANLYPDDYFNDWIIVTLDGTGKAGYAVVTDFTGLTCTFTVADWLSIHDESTSAIVDPATGGSTSYFVTDGLKHPVGQAFDTPLLAAIMVEASKEFGQLDFDAVGEYTGTALPEAHALDGRMRPRTVGRMKSGSPRQYTDAHHPRQHRSWTDVNYN